MGKTKTNKASLGFALFFKSIIDPADEYEIKEGHTGRLYLERRAAPARRL
jgi:hypothetical protein